MLKSNKLKLVIGILISAVFMYMAFNQIEINKVREALSNANYFYLVPASVFLFLSLWFRAYRWGILIKPLKSMRLVNLFSSLMVGYMANTIFPFKLGEFLRAHMIGKVENFSKVSSFATIVVERILDVIFLLLFLGIAIIFQPFTGFEYVKSSGLLMFIIAITAIVFLVFFVIKPEQTFKFYHIVTKILPKKIREKGEIILKSLVDGLLVLKKPEYYLSTAISSVAIWLCYIATLYILFFAFNLDSEVFNNDLKKIALASITVLVMSGISVSVPSSPGYVGTFHYLVMQGLIIYQVPSSQAFSFAVILHLFSIIPPAVIGMYYFIKQNISFKDALAEERTLEESALS